MTGRRQVAGDGAEAALRARIRAVGRAAVAYSGGVDSAVVLAVAVDELGDGVTALTAVSPSLPERERRAAADLARSLGARHLELPTSELDDPDYAANTPSRCYFCKGVVYRALAERSRAEGLGVLLDGTNADDGAGHRPGLRAAAEAGVVSPLAEAGLGKQAVRELARSLGLPVWDKPAAACLSSRLPYGTPVSVAALRRIEAAENAMLDLGFRNVRVRHHGDVARIEVDADDLPRAVELRERIAVALRAVGFLHVALDLEGFRSGSMNAALGRRPDRR